ncbi:SPOR domain-containing protein [Caminibacter sp.]
MKNDDLLNIEPKKDMKKPLVYGAGAFLVFVIIIIGVAIYQNSSSKENNEIIPPEEKVVQTQTQTEFKPLPVEEKPAQTPAIDTKKLIEEPERQEKPQVIRVEEPKKEIKKETQKPKETSVKQVSGEKNYYIQVAALLRNTKPNKKFLDLIKKEGFDYKLYKTYIVKNGQKISVTKVLIGPFTKEEAKKYLPKIRKNITQTAFIFKAK